MSADAAINVAMRLAAPPATTGASTAPVDGDRLYAAWHKVGADVAGLKFADFMAALGPIGASTAGLESILDRLENAIGGYSGGPFDKVQAIIDELRAAPDCGACPGDGSMCKSRCKVEQESPDPNQVQTIAERLINTAGLPAKESK